MGSKCHFWDGARTSASRSMWAYNVLDGFFRNTKKYCTYRLHVVSAYKLNKKGTLITQQFITRNALIPHFKLQDVIGNH